MDIKQIIKNSGFHFNKQFGQNFLTDEVLLENICDDAGVDGGAVLEIGAGAGTLTRVLSRRSDRVVAFEIDRDLRPILDVTLSDCDNVKLITGDVMRYSMEQIEGLCGGKYKVVANIPYYLTSPLVMRFVDNATAAQSMTLTVQKEVAERLAARPATKAYGAISVAVQAVADVKLTRILPRNLFYPVPNVDSAVVRITFCRDKFGAVDTALFRKTVRSAFATRRKTLLNCLLSGFGLDRERAAEIIAECGFTPDCRGEQLSVEQFVALCERLKGVQ